MAKKRDNSGGYDPHKIITDAPKNTKKRATQARVVSRLLREHRTNDFADEEIRRRKSKSAPFKGDAHAFLASIYRDSDLPVPVRMQAAGACIAYERPKLAAVAVSGAGGSALEVQHTLTIGELTDDQKNMLRLLCEDRLNGKALPVIDVQEEPKEC